MSRRAVLAVAALALAAAAAVALWRPWREPPSDEERITALFLEAAKAVEDKRVGDAVEAVSERYRGEGVDRRGVKQLLLAQVLRGEWVSVTVAGTRVKLSGDGAEAVVDVVLARSGKGTRLAEVLPEQANVNRLTCRLERESGEWRVVSGSRRPISLAEALAGPP
ncbi:MAG TPA: hypothetical protein VFR85_09910 [Anaeromyxobacteraceae bacterium]|nr:hypothetical protein [Anaeromyxobacteraceae bacterium]